MSYYRQKLSFCDIRQKYTVNIDLLMKILFSSLLILIFPLFELTQGRPAMQTIVINDHEWQVPNEPGWDEVVRHAEDIRQRLSSCISAAECRQVIEEIQAVFFQYPVSRRYFETYKDDTNDILDTIFKWG